MYFANIMDCDISIPKGGIDMKREEIPTELNQSESERTHKLFFLHVGRIQGSIPNRHATLFWFGQIVHDVLSSDISSKSHSQDFCGKDEEETLEQVRAHIQALGWRVKKIGPEVDEDRIIYCARGEC